MLSNKILNDKREKVVPTNERGSTESNEVEKV